MKKKVYTTKRIIVALTTLLVTTCISYFVKKYYLNHIATTSTSPSLETLEAINTSGQTGVSNIEKLWKTGRFPQQLFVIERIRKEAYKKDDSLRQKLQLIVQQAVSSVDSSIQIYAIKIIENSYPQDIPCLISVLHETDPQVRFQALRTLAKIGYKKYTQAIINSLDDYDQKNRIMAATALRRWHNIDFGARFNASDSTNTKAIKKWKTWWQKNRKKFEHANISSKTIGGPAVYAPNFKLKSLAGKEVELYMQKTPVIMLYFWGQPEHGEIHSMKELGKLAQEFKRELTILPIAVDLIPKIDEAHAHEQHETKQNEHDEHTGCDHNKSKDKEHKHSASCSHATLSFDQIKANWENHGFQKLCLIDDGSASFQYISNELPTVVLIRNKIVRKRFEGKRSLKTLRKMIENIIGSKN